MTPKLIFKVGDKVRVSDKYIPVQALAVYTTKHIMGTVLKVDKRRTRADWHKRYFYQIATTQGNFWVPNTGVKPIKVERPYEKN